MDRGYALEATQLYHAIDKVLQRNTLVLGGGGNESLPPPPLNAFLLRVAVAFVVDLEVSDLWTFVAVFVVLVPVSVPVIEVDSSGRPFLASPNVDLFASPSSSVEVVAEEPVDSSMGARSNYGLYSILSNLDLHQDRNLEPFYSNPSPDHNNVSDTNDLPKGATTNHSRKKSLH